MMNSLTDIGNLMHLRLEDIEPGEGTNEPDFLIQASANLLQKNDGHNWVPIIVKETGEDQYEVISNSLIYAIAEEAGLERVWCIIADDKPETVEISKVLAGEVIPKINLSKASRDEIMSALEYLKNKPASPLNRVDVLKAANRIDEAPRRYWKSFTPATQLGCGITKGKKLDTLKSVFYLTPEPMPEVISDANILRTLTATELKKMAKKREISGYSKMKKADLVEALSA